ncbi:MAG: hypothetical protein E3J56_00750 [Candidatus Aminicenantes bacterium]|nr:MAG: hypothetical protein E3J56_00750 [Candidatus Aminicenantes bacterium]
MKFKKNSFLLIFVVFFFLFCAKGEVLSQGPPIGKRIHLEPGLPEALKDGAIQAIRHMYRDLRAHFRNGSDEDGDFEAMATLLGDSAVIVYENTVYKGREAVAEFWRIQRREHDTVRFFLLWGFIISEKEEVGEERFDALSYETFWFEFNPDGEGEGSNRRKHREDCEWFDY